MRAIPLGIAVLGVACADGTLPARTAGDPGNPNAPEAPLVRDGSARESGESPSLPPEHHHPSPRPGGPP